MKLTKHLAIGPGGMKCACCFPPPGKRKAEFRKAKRKEAIEADKEKEQELQYWWDSTFLVSEETET